MMARTDGSDGENASVARPFVKWAGGKRSVIGDFKEFDLLPEVPESATYFEPFVGGGALFFEIQPKRAVLNDLNVDLILSYRVIRDDLSPLLEALKTHEEEYVPRDEQDQHDYYYRVRGQDPDRLGRVARAARFIFLNKTCFNGLYRVNSRGEFNVPRGRYSNPTICDEENLRHVRDALENTLLLCTDFRQLQEIVTAGDFIYCDPPYDPGKGSSSFTKYTEQAFGSQDQVDLAQLSAYWTSRNARVLLSNGDTTAMRKLYGGVGFECTSITDLRTIGASSSSRKVVPELAFHNYLPGQEHPLLRPRASS